MEIYISNSGTKPIYAQITNQIQAAIISGTLQEGDALPSIRLLAKELRISVITTKRAYEDLEKAGFINTVPGKGCFVAKQNTALHKEETRKRVHQLLQQVVDTARTAGITPREILAELEALLKGD